MFRVFLWIDCWPQKQPNKHTNPLFRRVSTISNPHPLTYLRWGGWCRLRSCGLCKEPTSTSMVSRGVWILGGWGAWGWEGGWSIISRFFVQVSCWDMICYSYDVCSSRVSCKDILNFQCLISGKIQSNSASSSMFVVISMYMFQEFQKPMGHLHAHPW